MSDIVIVAQRQLGDFRLGCQEPSQGRHVCINVVKYQGVQAKRNSAHHGEQERGVVLIGKGRYAAVEIDKA